MIDNDKNLIDILKKFPDQNPNPVIRVSGNGTLEYYNHPSESIIKFYDLKINKKAGLKLTSRNYLSKIKYDKLFIHRRT